APRDRDDEGPLPRPAGRDDRLHQWLPRLPDRWGARLRRPLGHERDDQARIRRRLPLRLPNAGRDVSPLPPPGRRPAGPRRTRARRPLRHGPLPRPRQWRSRDSPLPAPVRSDRPSFRARPAVPTVRLLTCGGRPYGLEVAVDRAELAVGAGGLAEVVLDLEADGLDHLAEGDRGGHPPPGG